MISSVDLSHGYHVLPSAELVRQGRDQRDYYYFVALGHYKLEVCTPRYRLLRNKALFALDLTMALYNEWYYRLKIREGS